MHAGAQMVTSVSCDDHLSASHFSPRIVANATDYAENSALHVLTKIVDRLAVANHQNGLFQNRRNTRNVEDLAEHYRPEFGGYHRRMDF